MSNLPLVGICIPVGRPYVLSWWDDVMRSIAQQDYPHDRIKIFQTIRYDSDSLPEFRYNGLDITNREYRPTTKEPTVYEQVVLAFDDAMNAGCEYVFQMTSHDPIGLGKISHQVAYMQEHPDVKVCFGNVVYCDEQLNATCSTSDKELHPTKYDLWDLIEQCTYDPDKPVRFFVSIVPDMAMVRSSILREFPFDAKYRTTAYEVSWIKTFLKYGSAAFRKIDIVDVYYRTHSGQLGTDTKFNMYGRWRLVEFLNAMPEIADRGLVATIGKQEDKEGKFLNMGIVFVDKVTAEAIPNAV